MSGIVGIVNLDGASADPRLLARLTGTLETAGPDRQSVWLDGAVGLGHAWLKTSDDAAPETQPLTLDGRTWITADARIDGREDLIRELGAHGAHELGAATDAALILHGYRVWGESCVDHLLGDFALAIWDGPRRRLFCARDHFGVKPFFYAETPGGIVVSTSLDCVRRHPSVSAALDERAIGDFLRVGGLEDPALTCFAAVRRLPAAHVLIADVRPRTRRYWTLPVDGEIRYRRGADYVMRFTEILTQAVRDRLRSRSVGVLMSGGLDSTTVAATARRCLAAGPAPFDLRAYTTVCERVLADPERRYAQLAADALAMPIHFRVVDDYEVFARWDKAELRRPEPESDPLLALHVDQLGDAAAHGRVLLTGYGVDPAVRLPIGYALDLVRQRQLLRLAMEVGRYVTHCRRLPRIKLGGHARRWLGLARSTPESSPAWLAPSLGVRAAPSGAAPSPTHASRPHAYEQLTSPEWPQIFERYDPGVTGVPVEVRHPFFDRRLVEYLLAIPPMPWCFDKTILRLAMRGVLPEAVRLRPKTVVAGDPLVAQLRAPSSAWVDDWAPVAALRRYVDRKRVPRLIGEADSHAIWTNVRPLCLNHWLTSVDAP